MSESGSVEFTAVFVCVFLFELHVHGFFSVLEYVQALDILDCWTKFRLFVTTLESDIKPILSFLKDLSSSFIV